MPLWSRDGTWHKVLLAAGIGLACWIALGQGRPPAQGAKPVIEIVRSNGEAHPPKLAYTAVPLKEATSPARGRAPAPHDFVQPLSSPALNARTPGSLPHDVSWRAHWETPLASPALAVLTAGDRILVQQVHDWLLLDRGGKEAARGAAGGSPITLDPAAGQFYGLGPGNTFQVSSLATGETQFTVPLGYDETFAWRLLCRTGKRLVAAAAEQPRFSREPHPPTRSLIQAIAEGSPRQVSPYKVLLSVDTQSDLLFNDPHLVPVIAGDTIWAVLPNLILRTSAAQAIDGAWSDNFDPHSASADEDGWLYLVADAGGRRELWVISPSGSRTVRVAVPAANHTVTAPPVIGYDHRVFLWNEHVIGAFSAEGRHLWDCRLADTIAAVTVTPDGHLLAAAGRRVYAVDTDGKATTVVDAGETVSAAPVATERGDLLVGTEKRIVQFSAGK